MKTQQRVKQEIAIAVVIRGLFLGLILFEFLNLIGFLNIPLDFSWFGLIITASFVWLVIELLIYKLKKQQYLVTILGLSFLVVFLDALGDICHFYSNFGMYDKFLHLLAGVVIAFLIFILTKDLFRNRRLHSVFVLGFANLFAVLYEIEEYLEDVFIHHRPLRLGTGPDTADDLLMNLVGALFIIFVIYLGEKILGYERETN